MPFARVGELELCYESFGEGEPMILVMGLGAQMVLWEDEFCRALAAQGFRVIRFDNRDVGRSTRLDHLGQPDLKRIAIRRLFGRPAEPPYRLEDMADDVRGLLDALAIPRAHLVGASLGGMVAQWVALRHPERVASLVCLMSASGELWRQIPRYKALMAFFEPAPTTPEEAEASALRFFDVVGSTRFPRNRERIAAYGRRALARGRSAAGVSRQFAAVLAGRDRRPLLRLLRVPTTVIHGGSDPLLPVWAGRSLAKAIPGAAWVRVEGLGHELPSVAWPLIVDAIVRGARRGRIAQATRSRRAAAC